MHSTLKNHPIWDNIARILKELDTDSVAIEHRQECNSQINGYWDEDNFYELISFTRQVYSELASLSLSISPIDPENHWINLKYALTINLDGNSQDNLGELVLILDESLNVIDENWSLDLASPYVLAR